ncbi:hypothetical protein, partial [Pseudomonas fluorescens]|uniref:hypothetical protein n=1 Tax=Pseudomonas fluorescens TaxID=294 RepID=UPI001AD8F889
KADGLLNLRRACDSPLPFVSFFAYAAFSRKIPFCSIPTITWYVGMTIYRESFVQGARHS